MVIHNKIEFIAFYSTLLERNKARCWPKILKISLLQVFSQLTNQRSGFRQNSCAVDEQACVFGCCAFNKHSVLRRLRSDLLNPKLGNQKSALL